MSELGEFPLNPEFVKAAGISMRLIQHWKPEPIEAEVERDAKMLLRFLGTVRSHDWEQRTGDETL